MSGEQVEATQSSASRRVLVTGASGTIGAEVAAQLAGAGDQVVALLHRDRRLVRNDGRPLPLGRDGLDAVAGDVGAPRLGLEADAYAHLRGSVDLIVHSAAVTEFGHPASAYRRVNVEGTREILDFAMGDGLAPIPLVHVSTAYVCGDRHGVVEERELDAGQTFANEYERSKYDGETLVRQAIARGLPATVVRPSIVVGSARTGAVREFKNIYTLLKVVVDGRLSVVPGNYDAVLDLVPIDYVAEAIADVARRIGESAGRTLHLVGETPLTVRDLGDVLAEYPSFLVPRFVPPQSFDGSRLSSIERRYHQRVVRLFAPYLTRRTLFATEEAHAFTKVRPASRGKPMLRKLLDHCLKAGYLGGAAPSVGSVLASLSDGTRPAVSPPSA